MESEENKELFAKTLSKAVKAHKESEFKGFMINLTHCDACVNKAKAMAKDTKYTNVGITTLASSNEGVALYKVNTAKDVKNTVIVYKNKKVVAKFVNLKMDKYGIDKLNGAIEKATL